jgi:hypothetical protein
MYSNGQCISNLFQSQHKWHFVECFTSQVYVESFIKFAVSNLNKEKTELEKREKPSFPLSPGRSPSLTSPYLGPSGPTAAANPAQENPRGVLAKFPSSSSPRCCSLAASPAARYPPTLRCASPPPASYKAFAPPRTNLSCHRPPLYSSPSLTARRPKP